MFRQGFTCPALLKPFNIVLTYGTVTHYGVSFQRLLLTQSKVLAYSAFARHY